ncbi:MAG: hypothetical protein ACO1QR_13440, partial [Chthoniobacteraceae bacterium]
MPTSWKLPAAAALLLSIALPSLGYEEITLRVQLDQLRGADLTYFLRAAVPEISDGSPRLPTDLKTVATLHQHVQENAQFGMPDEPPAGKATRQGLDRVLRAKIKETPLPTLRQLALGDGEIDHGNGSVLSALFKRLIEQEVKEILSEPKRKLVFPVPPTPMPEDWRDTGVMRFDPAERDRALGPFAKLLTTVSKEKPKSLSTESDALYALSRKVLSEDEPQDGTEFLRYTWDSWCGTGAAEFGAMNMTVALIALLRERRIEEAVGISFSVPNMPQWLHEPGQPIDQWRIDLLKYAGVDWEKALLADGRFAVLAAAGSEMAARQLLSTAKVPESLDETRHDLETLAAFLSPQDYSRSENDPRNLISDQVQKQILQLLNGVALNPRHFDELRLVMEILRDVKRPEATATLQKLVRHESTTIGEYAASLLRSLNEHVEPIVQASPVRFRIHLNGTPMRNVDLYYDRPGVQRFNTGDTVKTDSEGYLELSRDEFLDPARRNAPLVFSKTPQTGGDSPEALYDLPWLRMEVAIPRDFGAITPVKFVTCELPVEIGYPAPPPSPERAPMTIKVERANDDPRGYGTLLLRYAQKATPAPHQLVLSAVQPGKYTASVNAPGTEFYETALFEVKPGMPPVKIKLAKACDVYATGQKPINGRAARSMVLLRDGVDVSEQYRPAES